MSDEILDGNESGGSDDADLFGRPGQVVFLNMNVPILERMSEVLKTDSENGIHFVERAAEATQLVQTIAPCMVLLSGNSKPELIMASQFLMQNQDLLRKQKLKTLLLTKVKDPAMLDQFQKLGVTEILQPDISEYSFGYKLRLHLKALKAMKKAKSEEDVRVAQKLNEQAGLNKVASAEKEGVNEAPFLEIAEDVWLIKGEKPKKVGLSWLFDIDGPDPKSGEWVDAGTDEATGQKKWMFKASINQPAEKKDGPPKEGWVFTGQKPQSVGDPPKWRMAGKQPDLSYQKGKMKTGSKVSTGKDGKLTVAKDSATAAANIKRNKEEVAILEQTKKFELAQKQKQKPEHEVKALSKREEELEKKKLEQKEEAEKKAAQEKLEAKLKARKEKPKSKEHNTKDAEEKKQAAIKESKDKALEEKSAAMAAREATLKAAVDEKKKKEKEEAKEKRKALMGKLKLGREDNLGGIENKLSSEAESGGIQNKIEKENSGDVEWENSNSKQNNGNLKKKRERAKLDLSKLRRVDDQIKETGKVSQQKDPNKPQGGIKTEDGEDENLGGLKVNGREKKKRNRTKILDLKRPFGSLAVKDNNAEDAGSVSAEELEDENLGNVSEEDTDENGKLKLGNVKKRVRGNPKLGQVKREDSDKKDNGTVALAEEEEDDDGNLVSKGDLKKANSYKPKTVEELLKEKKERRKNKRTDLKKLKESLDKNRKKNSADKASKSEKSVDNEDGGFSWARIFIGLSDRFYMGMELSKVYRWMLDYLCKKLLLEQFLLLKLYSSDKNKGLVLASKGANFSIGKDVSLVDLRADIGGYVWGLEFEGHYIACKMIVDKAVPEETQEILKELFKELTWIYKVPDTTTLDVDKAA